MTTRLKSPTLRLLGLLALLALPVGYVSLAQLYRLRTYQLHQVAHVLTASGRVSVAALVPPGVRNAHWQFALDDDDPFVSLLTLCWESNGQSHQARWVIIHTVGWRGIEFSEIAALNQDAQKITPRITARESIRGYADFSVR